MTLAAALAKIARMDPLEVSATDANRRRSELFDYAVRERQTVRVTRNGRPWVLIVPLDLDGEVRMPEEAGDGTETAAEER